MVRLNNWRALKRTELLLRRQAVSQGYKRHVEIAVAKHISDELGDIRNAMIGFYWPTRGEIDLRKLIARCLFFGAKAALPVIGEKHEPMQFRTWDPDTQMTSGVRDIPVPANTEPVHPTILFVPLVGFDAAGYRLGYGQDYYNRTLASLSPLPISIGVGYESGRLASICPQSHDIPMDAIVTEYQFSWRDASIAAACRRLK